MKNSSRSDIDYKIWIMLTQIRNATVKARAKELKQFNMSAYESFILFVIHSMGDKATPAEISRIVFREPHTISELLSRLEKKGLITRSRNPKNRRMTRSKLTNKGLRALHQAEKRESIHKIFTPLSDTDRELLTQCLSAIRDVALNEIGVKRAAYFPSLDNL